MIYREDLFFGSLTSDINQANLGIIGIPWDKFSSYRQCSAISPDIIRSNTSIKLYNPFTESLQDIRKKWKIYDSGDILISSNEPQLTYNEILAHLSNLSNTNPNLKFIFLGGDHLTTYFSFKALTEIQNQNMGILYLDAHPDLYLDYDSNPYSHACVLRRLIDEASIQPRNIIQIGIRASTPQQQEFCQKKEIESISTSEFLKKRTQFNTEYFQTVFSDVSSVYLSIDLDVLDPAYAPGVGNPEPGGLSTRDLLSIINELNGLNLSGFDIVEFCPVYDSTNITAYAIAKIIKETLAVMNPN